MQRYSIRTEIPNELPIDVDKPQEMLDLFFTSKESATPLQLSPWDLGILTNLPFSDHVSQEGPMEFAFLSPDE